MLLLDGAALQTEFVVDTKTKSDHHDSMLRPIHKSAVTPLDDTGLQ